MNTEFQYQLDQSSRKFICPACNKRRFVRYIDHATGNYLPEKYGRCDREINCGFHLNPFVDGFGKNESNYSPAQWTPPPPEPPKETSYINEAYLKNSLTSYHQNNFAKWLRKLFNDRILSELLGKYQIGTSKHWPGATVFWQIDQAGKIRSGKIMGYDATTGRRIKEPVPQITWVHKALKFENFNLKQCFFGEHLLSQEPATKPVAIVESEKTAIVASVYLPRFVWLAAGSLSNINPEKCQPLTGRNIVLFPDLNCFDRWRQKATDIEKELHLNIKVSDLLENNATDTDRQSGFDLADYLVKFKLQDFLEPEKQDLKTQIQSQLQRLNPQMWIIDPEKFPKITAYNLEVLSRDLNRKNSLQITPNDYFTKYQEIFKN